MIPADVLKDPLSFSRLSTYGQCGEKFRLRYVERADTIPQGSFLGGRAVHEAIAEAEKQGWWASSLDDINRFFEDDMLAQVDDAGGDRMVRWGGRKTKTWPRGEDLAWWLAAGPVFLERYVAIRRVDAEQDTHVDHAELRVLAEMPGDDPPITGYVDAFMLVDQDGEKIIRDYKTGTYTPDATQLATYAWCMRQIGDTALRGQYIMLRRRDPAAWIVEVELGQYIDLVPRLYSDLAAGIRQGLFPLRPSSYCPSCAVKRACAYGSTLADDREGADD